MNVLRQVSFKVKGDLQSLDYVLGEFDQLNQAWIPRKDWLQSQLALAEGFTNAVRHAHCHLSSEVPIEVEIVLAQDRLVIRIWDQGPVFDMDGFLQGVDSMANRLAGHGQGLPILRKIAAELSYTRQTDNRNCLLIVKQFSSL